MLDAIMTVHMCKSTKRGPVCPNSNVELIVFLVLVQIVFLYDQSKLKDKGEG